MNSVTYKVTHDIGETIKNDGGVYKVIGHEFVKGRGIRYILLTAKSGSPEWLYLYDFEIKLLQ